jgi:hypothetical protein
MGKIDLSSLRMVIGAHELKKSTYRNLIFYVRLHCHKYTK